MRIIFFLLILFVLINLRQIIICANSIKHVRNNNVDPKTTTNDKFSTLNESTNRLKQQLKTQHHSNNNNHLKNERHCLGHHMNLFGNTQKIGLKTMEQHYNNSINKPKLSLFQHSHENNPTISTLTGKKLKIHSNKQNNFHVLNLNNNSIMRILKQNEPPINLLLYQTVPKFEPHLNDTYDQNDNDNSTTTTTTTTTATTDITNDENDGSTTSAPNPSQHDPYNVLLTSQSARHELAQYIFNELLIKNFTDSLDTSPIRFNAAFKEAISSAVNEPNILIDNSSSGSTSSASNSLSSTHNTSASNDYINQNHTTSLNNSLLIVASSGATIGGSSGAHLGGHLSGSPKPYFGDALYSFQNMYWPVHCIICLIICTLGIFANVTNIIVLTRPNMVTAVNNILSAMAFSDLIVNISNIPYLAHELSDSSNITSFFSFQWAVYILVHAHVTVTAHTISIWLTCVLATWRYFVVCRSQSSNQRNWSVGLAKRTIIVVFLFVPIFCIPNYLSFAISNDVTESNITIYKVGFSRLADNSRLIKTFHFWIFSCLTKLLPCILLTFFTTALIRKLLSARDRRVRLATYGTSPAQDVPEHGKNLSITSSHDHFNPKPGSCNKTGNKTGDTSSAFHNQSDVIINNTGGNGNRNFSETRFDSVTVVNSISPAGSSSSKAEVEAESKVGNIGNDNINININNHNNRILPQKSQVGSQMIEFGQTNENELIRARCRSNTSGYANGTSDRVQIDVDDSIQHQQQQQQQQRQPSLLMSQLFVESTDTTTISTTTVPLHKDASCDIDGQLNNNNSNTCSSIKAKLMPQHRSEQRSASTCGNLEPYSLNNNTEKPDMDNLLSSQLKQSNQSNASTVSSQLHSSKFEDHVINNCHQQNFSGKLILKNSTSTHDLTKHGSFKLNKNGDKSDRKPSRGSTQIGRSIGSITLSPLPTVRIQAAQRQISHNETTTRLLIAVMIVFLICEFPSGILAALCAVLGQEFFENVYQPTGILMDLLALINSSVNFILYCFMSTQFRVTFYQVVLHCPAPNAPQQNQTVIMRSKDQTNINNNNNNNATNTCTNSSTHEKAKHVSRNNY